jgi:hypothetical protein
MHTTNVQIEVLQPTGEGQSVLSTKDQSEILKEKYKKFRQSKKKNGEE